MTRFRLSVLLFCCLPGWALAQPGTADAGSVTVEFVEPDRYTDARLDGRQRRDAPNPVLTTLERYLQRQAPRHLAAEQSLLLRFTDIDLAGDIEPTANPDLRDIRVVRHVYPPRLRFDFVLSDDLGNVLREGSVDLRDLGFNLDSAVDGSRSLRYEKRMLRRWLARELGPRN